MAEDREEKRRRIDATEEKQLWPINPPLPDDANVFQLIRDSTTGCAEEAKFVKINQEKLIEFIHAIDADEIKSQYTPHTWNYNTNDEATSIPSTSSLVNASFLYILLQFGSGYRHQLHEACEGRGASLVIGVGLRAMVKDSAIDDASIWENVTAEKVGTWFGIAGIDSLQSLVEKLVGVISEAGRVLRENNCPTFCDWMIQRLEEAPHSAAHIVKALVNAFSSLNDQATLSSGRQVYLFKRAQLIVMEIRNNLSQANEENELTTKLLELTRFDDIEQLTLVVDNVIPAVLVKEGILVLDPELHERIQGRNVLPRGDEEIEMRACAIVVGEQIMTEAKKAEKGINISELTYFLWKRGKLPGYKTFERHYTPDTVFY